MGEHGQTFMLDGWRMQRWRMWSRVNKGTYKSEDGEDLGCLELTAAETYDFCRQCDGLSGQSFHAS